MAKRFDERVYRGTVVAYDAAQGFYKVEYEDGDAEECDAEELRALVAQAAAHAKGREIVRNPRSGGGFVERPAAVAGRRRRVTIATTATMTSAPTASCSRAKGRSSSPSGGAEPVRVLYYCRLNLGAKLVQTTVWRYE